MSIALDLASYNVVDAKLSDFREIIEKYVNIVFANEDEAKSFTGLAHVKLGQNINVMRYRSH